METNGNIKWDDDRIDDLARKAFSGQKFKYDSSFFAEVEKMLPPEKKKRVLGWWWLTLLPLVALVGYFYVPSKIKENQIIQSKNGESQQSIERENTIEKGAIKTENQTALVAQKTENPIAANQKEKRSQIRIEKNPSVQGVDPFTPSEGANKLETMGIASMDPKDKLVATQHEIIALVKASENDLPVNETRGSIANSGVSVVNTSASLEERPIMDIKVLKTYEVGRIQFKGLENITSATPTPTSFNRFSYRPRREQAMFVQAGLGLGSTVSNGQSNLVKTGTLGFGYQFQKGYWGGSIGLLAEVEKTFIEMEENSIYYSYDVNSYQNILQYTDFYRMDLPLTVQFKWKKSQINFGPTFQFLIHSSMDYRYVKNGVNEQSGVVRGEDYGMRNFNLQWSAGYGYYLTNNILLGAQFGYQMWNPIRSTEISNTVVAPFSGQVYVRHIIRQRR